MIYISIALGVIILCGMLPSIIVNSHTYKYYKSVYKTLPKREYYRNNLQVYSHHFYEKDDGFVYFLDMESFELTHQIYLHNAFFTWLDPYSAYWLIKYRRWFKTHIDINKIETY